MSLTINELVALRRSQRYYIWQAEMCSTEIVKLSSQKSQHEASAYTIAQQLQYENADMETLDGLIDGKSYDVIAAKVWDSHLPAKLRKICEMMSIPMEFAVRPWEHLDNKTKNTVISFIRVYVTLRSSNSDFLNIPFTSPK